MDPTELLAFIQTHDTLFAWLVALSLGIAVLTLIAVPWFAVWIPTDYFATRRRHTMPWAHYPPLVRWPLLVVKNLIGLLLLIVGLALLMLPGQGLLVILAGIVLLNFPGKYRFQRWLVQHGPILQGINWLRRRRGKPRLKLR